MQVYWQRLLEALGCRGTNPDASVRQPCPLHKNEERTLEVRRHPVTDSWQFVCHAPECRFKGDAPALVGRVKNITTAQAIELFRTGSELHHTLMEYVDIDEYITTLSNQAQATGYVAECQGRMAEDRGRYMQSLMADRGLTPGPGVNAHGLYPGVGLLTHGTAPHCLSEFNGKKCKQGYFSVYPYTLDGILTQVVAQNHDTASYTRIPVTLTLDGGGIFMEDNLNDQTATVCVATDEALACALYWKSYETINRISVVATPGLKFPTICTNIQHIYIVAALNKPLTLEQALHYLDDKLRFGLDKQTLYVYEIREPIVQVSHTVFQSMTGHDRMRLETWILRALRAQIKISPAEAGSVIAGANLNVRTREHLLAHASAMTTAVDSTVVDVIRGASTAHGLYELANGCKVRLTKSGIVGIRGSRTVRLSNIPLVVDQCIVQSNKRVAYQCRVMFADDKHVRVIIDRDYALSAVELTKAIQAELVRQGYTDYVMFYSEARLNWADIMACMASGRPMVKEIEHLGVVDNQYIHLPTFTVDTLNGRTLPQNDIYTLDDNLRLMYDIRPNLVDNWESDFRTLMATQDNVMAEGIVAGLMHILYQQNLARLQHKVGVPHTPRHFFYVDEGGGSAWYDAFAQLSRLFSGYDHPPTLSAVSADNDVAGLRPLGSLPAIIGLPSLTTTRLSAIIDTSPVGIISVISSRIAAELSFDHRRSFMIIPPTSNRSTYKVNHNDMAHLKRSMSEILTKLLSVDLSSNYIRELGLTRTGALLTYTMLCDQMDIEPSIGLINKLNWYYTDMRSGLSTFMGAAHSIVFKAKEAATFGIQRTTSMPSKSWFSKHNKNAPHIIELEDRVLVSVHLVGICNKVADRFAFDTEVITSELERNNYLAPPPTSATVKLTNYWCIRRDVWDAQIRQLPMDIGPIKDVNGSIPLRLVSGNE